MFDRGISDSTRSVLTKIKQVVNTNNFYLAGGTALSLWFGHRESVDLDFFCDKDFSTDTLQSKFANFHIVKVAENTLIGLIDDVSVSFFRFPYKTLGEFATFEGVNVASVIDIALMKLNAISKRNEKKDFIDLFYIINKEYPLKVLLSRFNEKFPNSETLDLHLIKSLGYFEDADKQPMPKMFEKIEWQEIKNFFKKQVAKILK